MQFLIKQRYTHKHYKKDIKKNKSMLLGPLFLYYLIVMKIIEFVKDFVIDQIRTIAITLGSIAIAFVLVHVFRYNISSGNIQDIAETGISILVAIWTWKNVVVWFLKRRDANATDEDV